jgi:mannose-1-phosphate guanylyltransferase
MRIDYALILSAGLGTRMGEIGKIIPKVLWPIYFKTMLELQIKYCEDLGVEKIYINTHFLHKEIQEFLVREGLSERVIVLHEETLLDSGGAIHNLAIRPEVNYKGHLLLVNGDQFLFFEKAFWEKALTKLKTNRATLFGINVDKNSAYNETIVENEKLIEIRKNTERQKDYVTYSGLGLLRLDGLPPVPKISRFFETVANYNLEKVELITPENFEYWDFGTAEVYAKNIFLLNPELKIENKMADFLKRHSAFSGKVYDFINQNQKSIDLKCSGNFSNQKINMGNVSQAF